MERERHPEKLTRMRWNLKLFSNISLLGSKSTDLYSLQVTRLLQCSEETCQENPSVYAGGNPLPKDSTPSQEEDQ